MPIVPSLPQWQTSSNQPLPEQQDVVDLGGTMRLGLYPCRIPPNTLAFKPSGGGGLRTAPASLRVQQCLSQLVLETGYAITGTSPDGRLVEIIELPNHPHCYTFHPEFHLAPAPPILYLKGCSSRDGSL